MLQMQDWAEVNASDMNPVKGQLLFDADMRNVDSSALLLITANVGTLFEDPLRLLQLWLKEFFQKIKQLQPQFIALHLQEVGGKTYEKSKNYVKEFIRCLCEGAEMQDFIFVRIYMDEDFNSIEHFTALGNLYFGHKKLKGLRIWNFINHSWEHTDGKSIFLGSIESISTKEKSKFPLHFFPDCKWSRKGFMRTRWEINGTVIDFVNIHLFHDASNLTACQKSPSTYCQGRRRALVHILQRFHSDKINGLAPYFVFGDFNFRCDIEGVIKELTSNLTVHRVDANIEDSLKMYYRNEAGENVLIIGKKEFHHAEHQIKFREDWLKTYDRELDGLKDILTEYDIQFPPSYPYKEDPSMPSQFMSTRCPSWCDRILMSREVENILSNFNSEYLYNFMGKNVCMGDHKPVYLNARIKSNQGLLKPEYDASECLQRITQNLLVMESDIWKKRNNVVPKSRYIRFGQTSNGSRLPEYYGMIQGHSKDCAGANSLNKPNRTQAVAILKETEI